MLDLKRRQIPMYGTGVFAVGDMVWFFAGEETAEKYDSTWFSGRVTEKKGSWYTVEATRGEWVLTFKFNGAGKLHRSFDDMVLAEIQLMAYRMAIRIDLDDNLKLEPTGCFLDRIIRLSWMLNR